MLFLILAFMYVFVISYSCGWMCISLLKKWTGIFTGEFILILITGLAFITTAASVFSLFCRINWEFQLVLLACSLFASIKFKPWRNFKTKSNRRNKWKLILEMGSILVLAFLVLYSTSLEPANPDTKIYHAQTIHWIETYPAVPGLANLHVRFGYNSSWLVTNAVFSFSYLGLRSFHFMTGFLFFFAGVYFLSGIRNIGAGRGKISDYLKIGFLLALFLFLIDQASSPGTDAPTSVLEWIIIAESVRLLEQKDQSARMEFFFIALLAAYSVTIKISAAPILLAVIPITVELIRAKKIKSLAVLYSTFLVMAAALISRNLIISGYLVFPGPAVDLFHFDWRVPMDTLKAEMSTIHSFAAIPHLDQSEFEKLTLRQWSTIWYDNLIPRQQAVLLSILYLPLFQVLLGLFKSWRNYVSAHKSILLVFAAVYAGNAYWFFSAPAIRFGYGFLLGALMLNAAFILTYLIDQIPLLVPTVRIAALPVTLAGILLFSRSMFNLDSFQQNLLLPADYPQWATVPCTFKNFTSFCQADYDACWYSNFPCALHGDQNVEMRGPTLRQGFRNTLAE